MEAKTPTGLHINVQMQVEPVPVARASSLPPVLSLPSSQVGYVYSSKMMLHSCIDGHPEQPERISKIHSALQNAGCLRMMKQLPIRPVVRKEALLVHTDNLWDKINSIRCMSFD